MDAKAIRLIWYGQFCFYIGVLLCIVLRPTGLAANDGISYYGYYHQTILPYALAMLGSAACCFLAPRRITDRSLKPLALTLLVMAVMEVMIFCTPVTFSHLFKHIHTTMGTLLFSLQLLAGIWLTSKVRYNFRAVFFTAIELVGGIGSAIWVVPSDGFLIQSQLVFQLGFSGVLLYSANRFRTDNVLQTVQKRQPTARIKTA